MANAWSQESDDGTIVLAAALVVQSLLRKRVRIIKHDSILTGAEHYKELMETESESRFSENVHMDRPTFQKLLDLLMEHGKLCESKGFCYIQQKAIEICPGEKVTIFIDVLVGLTNRKVQEIWQHSGSTISTVIHTWRAASWRARTSSFAYRVQTIHPILV